jgi:hypothetical protein
MERYRRQPFGADTARAEHVRCDLLKEIEVAMPGQLLGQTGQLIGCAAE